MLWGALSIAIGVVVIDLVIHAVAVAYILPILERSPPFNVEPTPRNPLAEAIEFPTTNGLTLRGSLHRPPGPARGLILFCPELGGQHWSAVRYCPALIDAGFAILAFDFRNQGSSDSLPGYTPIHWTTEYEVEDALAAIACLQSRGDLRNLPLGCFGLSRGGGAALVAAARTPEVKCVAVEGVFSISAMMLHFALRWISLFIPAAVARWIPKWHYRVSLGVARLVSQARRHCRYTILENWLPRLSCRALMIVDGRDTYVVRDVSDEVFRHFPAATSRQWIVPMAKHNLARQAEPEEFDRQLVEFFSPILLPLQPASQVVSQIGARG